MSGAQVVIFGAGVNGAGLFRDLCEQGVDCLIVDKGDFGTGASAAPSRLIHGGLKYLETGEFRLVAQSTLERNLLLRNAPHCVSPLETLVPIFSWWRGVPAGVRTLLGSTTAPRSRGALLVKIGLALYDYYGARHRVMPRHRMRSRAATLAQFPGLTRSIVASGTYYDARITRPERLVYELVADGLAAHPNSTALTYARLLGAKDGTLVFENAQGRTVEARPRLVVNAAGPWIDQVNASLGRSTKMIGGTKGSHVLLRHDALLKMLGDRMIYFEADDGRICLVYAYEGLALVGSTDIPADDPDAARCEDDEIDYFLERLRALAPALRFVRADVVYAYCGVRPLPVSDSSAPGLISRDHSMPLLEAEPGRPFPIVSLVGGKWTTFRGFAEEAADLVLKRLARARLVSTQNLPIGGGRDFPKTPTARANWIAAARTQTGLPAERLDALLKRYGATALEVARHVANLADDRALAGGLTSGEIDFIARREHVLRLADIVMRRTTLAISGVLTQQNLSQIADVASVALGWTQVRREAEISEVTQALAWFNRFRVA
jgi:glycerol-3-phosphate dehydrogenase